LNIDGVKAEMMGDFQIRLEGGTWNPPPDMMKIRHTDPSKAWQYQFYRSNGNTNPIRSWADQKGLRQFWTS
jgi:hypothetical protein